MPWTCMGRLGVAVPEVSFTAGGGEWLASRPGHFNPVTIIYELECGVRENLLPLPRI
jgi:hypothetical protein